MNAAVAVLVPIGLVVALTSCGGDDDAGVSPSMATSSVTSVPDSTSSTSTSAVTTTTVVPVTTTTIPPTTTTAFSTTTTTSSTTSTTTTTTEPARIEYPPVWPGPDGGLDTPDAAAEAFVSEVLGVPPLLGEFEQADSRSGEFVVFSPTDDDDPATVFPRGVVAVRRLLPTDRWFVIAGSSEGVTITSPAPAATVPAGPVVVEGLGRGFESNLVVRAILAGDPTGEFDLQFTMTDWTTPVPYAVTLDLSAAAPGDVVTLVAVGDTGLGTDPSEFAAIPIVIAG